MLSVFDLGLYETEEVFATLLDVQPSTPAAAYLGNCMMAAFDVVEELLAQPVLPLGWGTYVAALKGLPLGEWGSVLVDEAQDLNSIQLMLLGRLADKRQLVAVGDDRQSIYRFRGARAEAMPMIARISAARKPALPARSAVAGQ